MGSNSRRTSTGVPGAKDQTRLKIERMEAEREERKRAMQQRKLERAEEEARNIAAGNPGDVDFIGLVRRWRESRAGTARPHAAPPGGERRNHPKICICVRKRPVSDKERNTRDHDSVTCLHPTAWVHSAKFRVDGITKYLDHASFRFDHAFDEDTTTEEVYEHSTMPLVDFVCSGKGGRATVFAYGQTGSGKTHTMSGIQTLVAEDLFLSLTRAGGGGCTLEEVGVTVTFFEIYGGRIQDLLNERKRLKVLEDGKGEVVISGLEEFEAGDPSQFMTLVDAGNNKRTTHATEANDTSSRSHAICQILLRDKATSRLRGKLSLVDLAGSERGTDTKSHNRQRRTESSEINTSLLALKECIRALDASKSTGGAARHVPYRASKLTLILKDCFTSSLARTTMIATVSPGASSADHTLNTLRYADRIKEKKVGDMPDAISEQGKKKSQQKPSDSKNPFSVPSRASSCGVEETDEMLLVEEEKVSEDEAQLHHTVQSLFEEEEELLNLHMSAIQETAELLTEEGRLLQGVQGDDVGDYDIDQYASRLGNILDRKTHLCMELQERLSSFKEKLREEEELSSKVGNL